MFRPHAVVTLVIIAAGAAAGHGAGAWLDPNHQDPQSLAGTRFIAEAPPHVLTLVGTDDGKTWYTLQGSCSGAGMTQIHLDFSPKGGPANLTGVWSAKAGGGASITWPDGNIWSMITSLTDEWVKPDGQDDHQGLFTKPGVYRGHGSFAGTHFLSEFPPHVLTAVGTDDGKRWQVFKGKCTGEEMTQIDLTTYGLDGVHMEGVSAVGAREQIAWTDGTVWRKPSFSNADVDTGLRNNKSTLLVKALCGILVVGLGVVALGRWHHANRVLPLAEKDTVQKPDASHLVLEEMD